MARKRTEDEQELFKRIKGSFISVRIMVFAFLIVSVVFHFVPEFYFPPQLFLLEILWLVFSYPFLYFIEKARSIREINNSHFVWVVCELIILTGIIHFIEGLNWLGPIFYILFIIYEVFLFEGKQRLAAFFSVLGAFITLVTLEFLEIIPQYKIFKTSNLYGDIENFLLTLVVELTIIIFSFIAVSSFHKELAKKNAELKKAYGELEKIKNSLAIKVSAKTKQLKKLNQTLEKQVEERTKELNKRLEELEKFRKITIGRELKMVELKKKIEKLEKGKKS